MKNSGMKVIGIIGGVSWASSIDYYKLMNEMVRDRFGSLFSANILMYSIPFKEFSDQERLAEAGDWKPIINMMIESAKRLERGGADFIVIASNTMNSTVEILEKNVNIPILHIADATGEKINETGLKKVALLGTKFTMEHKFYKERLKNKFGLDVVVPTLEERDYINRIIFDELCNNYIVEDSKIQYLKIINRLIKEEGAEGIILGCTEIPMLVKQEDVSVPVFNTTIIHSEAAVKYSAGLK
jgi:aspartate racemase